LKSLIDFLAVLIGSGFYTGYAPIAPGTFGTMVGVAIFVAAAAWPATAYVSLVLGVSTVGIWASSRCTVIYGEKDSPRVVIDEVAGFLLAMVGVPLSWGWVTAGFLIFRLGDIFKPPPARWIDTNVGGGLGIVLDDLVAGIYTLAILRTAMIFLA
jgi:phosphatidylglycerophosphatase A